MYYVCVYDGCWFGRFCALYVPIHGRAQGRHRGSWIIAISAVHRASTSHEWGCRIRRQCSSSTCNWLSRARCSPRRSTHPCAASRPSCSTRTSRLRGPSQRAARRGGSTCAAPIRTSACCSHKAIRLARVCAPWLEQPRVDGPRVGPDAVLWAARDPPSFRAYDLCSSHVATGGEGKNKMRKNKRKRKGIYI